MGLIVGVQELHHLALAVVQAGAYISRSDCGFARYLELYRERRGALLEEHQRKVDGYERTVYTAWSISYDQLSQQAVTFLNVCAFLHHDGITEAIFRNATAQVMVWIARIGAADQQTASFRMAREFLGLFQTVEGFWDSQKFLHTVLEIRSYSLIDFDESKQAYMIHPLIHSWIPTTLPDTGLMHACTQWILGMSIKWESSLEDYAFRRGLLCHIDTTLQSGTPEHVDIAVQFSLAYHEGGQWREAEMLQLQVMETRKQVLGEEHPDTLTSMANMASTYWNQGRWKEAEVLNVQVLEATKRVLGEEHPDTLTSMANLASTYWNQGRWKEAEVLDMLAMETRK
jgi:hypothetical protein